MTCDMKTPYAGAEGMVPQMAEWKVILLWLKYEKDFLETGMVKSL